MKVTIDLTSIIMLIAVFLLIWIIADMVKMGPKEKTSPVIVRDVEVYDYPTWYGWFRDIDWMPWNWSTRYWGGGSHGNVWFGPGKPCHGWHCEKEHAAPAPQPQPQPQPTQPAEPIVISRPTETLPIQDIPVEPPTAQQDMQVALAPTPQAIAPAPEQTNIGTQTDTVPAEAQAAAQAQPTQ
jgi:hypothetical protein